MRPHAPTLAFALLIGSAPAFAQQAPTPPIGEVPAEASAPVDAVDAAPIDAAAVAPGVSPDGPSVESAEPPVTDEQAADATAAPPPADTATADAPPPAGDPRTEAERDFDALYNPVADPTLPTPAQTATAYDPWEGYNRRMHRFNNAVDRRVAKPLARTYVRAVPRPMRLGVSNFFSNLGQPVTAVNALLQGKPRQAAKSLGRFLLNSTLGIGGLFDPASDAKLPRTQEDFGQTLGIWGWKRSRYLELPFFGPRTVRDAFGLVGDAPLSPLRQVELDKVRIPLQGLQLVDTRAQLLSLDSLREGAEDDYTLVRDAWWQRRNYQIFGERRSEELPEYLREENNPTVPVDAMPVLPADGS